MPVFYFEIIDEQKGWLRIEAPTLKEAQDAITADGFDNSNIIGSESHREVTIEDSRGVS